MIKDRLSKEISTPKARNNTTNRRVLELVYLFKAMPSEIHTCTSLLLGMSSS